MNLWQSPIPDRYSKATDDALITMIESARATMGDDLVILGHHYQQDSVIRFADFTGDSFKLSQLAAERVREVGAKYVVFCGVHFMAESADILAPEGTQVILPDLSAGCSMADMADEDQCIDAWEQIAETLAGQSVRVVPICYMNCSAAIKAFCGERGGAVCTSSNAHAIIEWALAGGATPLEDGETVKILFIPDQHLGRNTAAAHGYKTEHDVEDEADADMCVWDPRSEHACGGAGEDAIKRSTFILWKGHCSVHKLFRPEHVDEIRDKWPVVHVMIHPECDYRVCQKADSTGSTEGIIQTIQNAAPGKRFAIGTEVHLVNRLAEAAKERGVTARILSECQCLCTTMYRIDLPHMAYVLEELVEGRVVNQIIVPPQVKHWSQVALGRMLEITGAPQLVAVD